MKNENFVDPTEFASVDVAIPVEEGGPTARTGFNYQDEIAVSFLLDMLENSAIEKIHCETHDDVIVVRTDEESSGRVAEFIQVKAGEPDKLWSVADLCKRKKGKPGTSIFETSLARDRHLEKARFRIVTLRDVNSVIRLLTYQDNAPARHQDAAERKEIIKKIQQKCPGFKSEKGNGADYWVDHCLWEVRHSEKSVKQHNELRIIQISFRDNRPLLPEQAEKLLVELRQKAKTAGDAKWSSERHLKIFSRAELRQWWERRLEEVVNGVSAPSGGKLRGKMEEAALPPDLVELAVDLRRRYAASFRTSRYMKADLGEELQGLVQAEVISLKAEYVAGNLNLDAPGFHALCLSRLDEVNAAHKLDNKDHSVFLKGCMYDISDRCMLRFVRPQ
ncbi:dsDNA nuclease domain-containing protein [Halomonas icarae]|uniref:DUF4297 domain-containing protein n=1 Tax=Halomonas icarae TaxID=2691040 RepID=A0A7X4W277_9GAMM|nr:dsDNA nuclease domain-containing protein [Halomonas icarae]MDR5903590.1 dsDNA nuclease domain-containing protein [Halomonas icarae]NAW14360.1 DUF4297 domain-containing protein [Halomonas icarae]